MNFDQYKPYIKELPEGTLTKGIIFSSNFLLRRQKTIEIYYAPFDYVNPQAKVVFVGITPGFTQMEISYRVARDSLLQGMSDEQTLKHIKEQASFAGTMRKNLIDMLDGVGLNESLHLSSTASLFDVKRHLLHSTSVLRYPVFVDSENYTGHNPPLLRSSLFKEYIHEYFSAELAQLQNAIFVPMGKAVSDVLKMYINEGKLVEKQCLLGFPHPSGANGHRKRQYEQKSGEFKDKIQEWLR